VNYTNKETITTFQTLLQKVKHGNLCIKTNVFAQIQDEPPNKTLVRKNILILILYTQYIEHIRLYVPFQRAALSGL